jgi:hypothetical protein
VRRQKTGKYFQVPFYPYLKSFLVDLYERQGQPYGDARVFRVADCKKTLRTVCRQLGLPHFSPRSLLQAQVLIPSSRQISQFAIL